MDPSHPTPPMAAGSAGGLPEPRGYFIVLSQVTDEERFETYRHVLAKLREIYGGRYLVRAQPIETFGRPSTGFRLTIVEHPTRTQLRLLLASPEYETLHRELGLVGAGPSWAVPGLSPPPAPLPPAPEPRAYAVTRTSVQDAARLERYEPLVAALVAAHGGRILVRTADVQAVSGPADLCRLAVVEFPSQAALRAALASRDMGDMRKIWEGIGRIDLWIAAGVTD